MKKVFSHLFIVTIAITAIAGLFFKLPTNSNSLASEVEPEFETVVDTPLDQFTSRLKQKFPDLENWQRPAGPTKIALQIGHYQNAELPNELKKLIGSTGTTGGGTTEVAVNFKIANLTASLLKEKGYEVEILPATVPPGYWADLFLAIHADGNGGGDSSATGFKASAPYRDLTGNGARFVRLIEQEYKKATGLQVDSNITRNMRGYYAFNWWKYDHSVHPKTTAVILETGFLTSSHDRQIIVNAPDKSAAGIVAAIELFFANQK
jgi:hypothetical protein